MIDTHTHYFLEEFDSVRKPLIEKLKEFGITRVLEAGITLEGCHKMHRLFRNEPMVYYSAGIHPLHVVAAEREFGLEGCKKALSALICSQKTIAVGETGLDFHREGVTQEEKEIQKSFFRMQLSLASEYNKPLVLHIRGCHEEALELLESYKTRFKGVSHCFIGSAQIAQRYIDLGFMLGIGGSCTYSKARVGEFHDDLGKLPLSDIVLETDAPYLKPSGCRGKNNTSINLTEVVNRLSDAMGISPEEIIEKTTENAMRCFWENETD